MNKHFSVLLSLLILLAACGGGDAPEEQACIDPINMDNVRTSYDLNMEASFESGTTYRFPSAWSLNEISETEHELRIPRVPPIVFRIVDTAQLRSLGMPESISTAEEDFDRYAEAYYEGLNRNGFSSGTALGQPFADGQFELPCEGEANVRLFNNADGRAMAVDLRSESGPIPSEIEAVRVQLWRTLSGQ